MRYFRQIDGLRAFAVGCVLFHHFVVGKLELGTFGVILFFVISGFLITGILLESKSSIASGLISSGHAIRLFYIRRFLRIFPLYFLVLALLCAFNVAAARRQIWWLATYTINFWIAIHHRFPVATAHFWSLAVEEQFYMVWPCIILFVPRRSLRPVMLALVAAAVSFRAGGKILFHLDPTINALTLAQLDSLSLGGLLALRNPADTKRIRTIGTFAAPLLAVELVLAYLGVAVKLRWLSLELLCGVCAAALVSFAAQEIPGVLGHFLSSKPMVYLGTISYGIYVYHIPIIVLVPHRVLAVPLTLLVASLSFYLFEKPINSLKRHFTARAQRTTHQSVTVSG